ncbi:hypothetical protein C8R44DRAFT_781516 [Mycena epipterygia]|nr:hypothetical protein C8R44DRAFT_781516 [Mycena epipterygia]
MPNSPPVYEALGAFAASVSSLPAYSPRDPPHAGSRRSTEHIFSLHDKKRKIRATLKLFSSAPTPASLPTFLEGDKINGNFTLNIPSSEKIVGVSVLVRGEIITGPQQRDRLCFLDIPVPLWSKSLASPSLGGDCYWPFSIHIPKDVLLADPEKHDAVRSYLLPQTFLERGTKVSAHYYLSVQIIRSAMLFREDELQTMFVYVPALRPEPPSILRQLAYQENIPIPGPEIDGDGWHTCPSVTMRGTVFNNRQVEVQCVFSLAKPLSYTRGSVIPCSLTYFCRDLQALNLLCTPSTVQVRLNRQVKCRSLTAAAGSGPALTTNDIEESGRAVWWLNGSPRQQDSRKLEGEIHLPKNLKPTSAISSFTLKYFVVVLPFSVTGFLSTDTQPLIEQEVCIGTIFAKGPRPRYYASGSA